MGISRYNPSGKLDMTAYLALTNIEKERKQRTAAKKEQDQRCWECRQCNRCARAFKESIPCEHYDPRNRRKKNA